MARSKTYDDARVTTALRLTPELHEHLHRAAQERGISGNRLAEMAIADYLARLIPINELRLVRDA